MPDLFLLSYPTKASAFNAGAKAPDDIADFLAERGCRIIVCNYTAKSKRWRQPLMAYYPFRIFSRISRGSTVIFQHPYDTAHDALMLINRILMALLRLKSVKTVAVVHDLESIRFGMGSIKDEAALLNKFDKVVVHSEAMREVLVDNGLVSEQAVLGLFDYRVTLQNSLKRSLTGDICFAGNLVKSEFLKSIPEMDGIRFHLYGREPGFSALPDHMIYEGGFKPDDLSCLKGDWGLVWDGDSVDSCSGNLGRYLRYNSPHKASLYVCAGMPLIVPADSAVAGIVRRYGIGLTVGSLLDLSSAIASVSEDSYAIMLANVESLGLQLMSGHDIISSIFA